MGDCRSDTNCLMTYTLDNIKLLDKTYGRDFSGSRNTETVCAANGQVPILSLGNSSALSMVFSRYCLYVKNSMFGSIVSPFLLPQSPLQASNNQTIAFVFVSSFIRTRTSYAFFWR